ncbi:MAG: Hpt domain-containing protein [Hyphomonadaceae bacterium]
MTKPAAQIIDARATGLRTLDLRKPLFDESAIARADKALELMGESMEQWLGADVERLQGARRTAETQAWSDTSLDGLMSVAHDVKGMGTTYGYPLATQIAASLCRLIETPAGKAVARQDPTLVCAHVDALRAIARDHIKDEAHPIGRALLGALEAQVARLGVAPR